MIKSLFRVSLRKRPLNPMPIFTFGRISSGVAVILLFGSLYLLATFSAHHLNRYTDPVHSALLTESGDMMFAPRLPLRSEPANNQFLRPNAQGRIWFSIELLQIGRLPSSR